MGIERLSIRVLAGMSLFAGFGLAASAQPPAVTVEDALRRQPQATERRDHHSDAAQAGQCKVEPIPNKNDPKTPLGYVVRDAGRQPGPPVRELRRQDLQHRRLLRQRRGGVPRGLPAAASEPYQFRWLGPNGTKWGLDHDRDGSIDEWVVMSPEELSQELLPGRPDQGREAG